MLVGPLEFVLDREQWLARYRTGDLVTEALDWHDAEVRDHGDCAISVGVHTQRGAYRGNTVDGEFRSTTSRFAAATGGCWPESS
ncbi:nuclear transport factor 2 family protein [Saccharopolyspora sp. NPDC002376]